jgi:cytochrome c oxidase assembly factor CtaG
MRVAVALLVTGVLAVTLQAALLSRLDEHWHPLAALMLAAVGAAAGLSATIVSSRRDGATAASIAVAIAGVITVLVALGGGVIAGLILGVAATGF